MLKHTSRNRKLTIISLALITIILVSYIALIYIPNSIQASIYATSDEKACSVDARLISANTNFAFNLLKALFAEDSDKNIFISPLSISTALAMVYNGADGTTKDAMANTLNFGNMTLDEINQAYSDLIESIESADQAVNLLIGNSVWIRKEFESSIKPIFIERAGTFFSSEIFTKDFGNLQTVNEINGWVNERTEGKVTEIVSKLEPELVMLLINAIYFKGEWKIKFDEAQTHRADFYLSDGNTVKVDTMTNTGEFSYYLGDACEVVRLPYGRDKIAMYIFLPNEDTPLDLFIANMNQTTHDEYIGKLHSVEDLMVNLPKFKVEYGVKRLNNVLVKLGMGLAFSDSANFNGISSTPLYLSYVDHKAIVEVNEKGTEAAAATSAGISFKGIENRFVANRPFYYEIRDDRSGAILFLGEILNPTLL